MQFRFVQSDEIPSITRLVSHSFIGRSSEFWAEQLRDPPHGHGQNTLFAGFADDEAVAALQLFPFRQWIAGQPFAMGGIGTVTVSPTHRQKGVAAQLMQAALRAARDRGDVASALYPFRNTFYQKLGYGLAGTALQYLVPPESIPPSAERNHVVLLESNEARDEAFALYSRWIRGQTGQLERSARSWDKALNAAEGALVGYRDEHGELGGYALLAYRAELPVEQRYLEANEMIWMHDRARAGLLGWLASLGDQWRRIMLRGLPSHLLTDILLEPRLPHRSAPGWALWTPAATLLTGPMFRLLDMEKTWSARRSATGDTGRIALHVVDRQIEENAGDWVLEMNADGARVQRGTGGDVRLETDVSTLSRIFIGALKPTAALRAGFLSCDRPERLAALDAALELPEPWMFDRF